MSYSISIIKNLWIVLPWWQGNSNEKIIYASYLYASLKRQNYFLFMLYEVISTMNLDKIQSCQNMIFTNFKTSFFSWQYFDNIHFQNISYNSRCVSNVLISIKRGLQLFPIKFLNFCFGKWLISTCNIVIVLIENKAK